MLNYAWWIENMVYKAAQWFAVQECDARMLNQGYAAGYKKIRSGDLATAKK